ncbi:MAG: hypothetical protein KO206_05050 [Methanomicrobiaceae archaeon]|uniref:Methyltransferase n=1 Tax=hydrocarbon metagenome TaxID=938273 RepID=A0A0W8FJI5_9ZZZZ|nr:hypothetical protein [Methanomicrobiaceae archaeon]MDD5418978.1 hypothetical protein [Methanomicrobiaceae archaeon]
MTVEELLEIPDCRLIEPSFADLIDDCWTAVLLGMEAGEGRLLLDEEEYPLALAVRGSSGWYAGTFLFRAPTREVIERFEEVGGDIYQEAREAWLSAVREYYSTAICRDVLPAMEDLPPDRPGKIRSLIGEVFGERGGTSCLDCCCGSGVGTAALRACGMRPLAYDNDPALLSLGLTRRRLLPAETICIDARDATRFIAPVPLGVALMAGEIYSHNAGLWQAIIAELLALTDRALITVGTEPEVRMVSAWCAEEGRSVETFENERDSLYDRWCCIAGR